MPPRPLPGSAVLAPVAGLLALALATAPAVAAPGADLLEPDAGTETSATAEALALRTVADQRIVLGPADARDVDWFVARAAAGTVVLVRLRHRGEVDGRPLALRARGVGGPRSVTVPDRGAATLRVRAGASGRVRLRIRCAGEATCDAGGAIPYRVSVAPAAGRRP